MPNPSKLNRPKVSINEHRLLVDLSKSKKLAAMANKSAVVTPVCDLAGFSGLKSEPEQALQQARQRIDARIAHIMNSFPEAKRNKLFNLRFGSVVAIQALEIKIAFKQLGIDAHPINMRLLAAMNYHGDTV